MDSYLYQIQLRGQIAEEEINAMSPLFLVREQGDTAVSLFSVCTDQSGLVGLLRHLHNLGFIFLSIKGESKAN